MRQVIQYTVLKQALNTKTALHGEVDLTHQLGCSISATELFAQIKRQEKELPGRCEHYAITSSKAGRIEEEGLSNRMLSTGEHVLFCPKVSAPLVAAFLALPLLTQIGAGIALLTIGYTIYSYVDMRSQMNALKDLDPTKSDSSASQAYSFDVKENYTIDGMPIPVLYGKTKLGGVVINRLFWSPLGGSSERTKILLGLGEGVFDTIAANGEEDIFVNDTTLDNFVNYEYTAYLGTNAQEPPENFKELYQQVFPDVWVIDYMPLYLPFDTDAENHSACLKGLGDKDGTIFVSARDAPMTSIGGRNCINLTGLTSYCEYEIGTYNLTSPFMDPFAIQFQLYMTTPQFNMLSVDDPVAIWTAKGIGSDFARSWSVEFVRATSGEFYIQFLCYDFEKLETVIYFRSKTVLFPVFYTQRWFHVYLYRSGQDTRVYFDGVDVTSPDPAHTHFRS